MSDFLKIVSFVGMWSSHSFRRGAINVAFVYIHFHFLLQVDGEDILDIFIEYIYLSVTQYMRQFSSILNVS